MFRRSFLMSASALMVFCVSSAARAEPPAKEQTRIQRLIAFVENQKGMKFIRNGTEYSCADAAKFLRGKMDSMGGEVTSAHEFIERIASKSSMSGQPYQVKFADGKTMLAAQFLSEELKRLEGQPT
jgi:hypothetical protein